MNNLRLSLANLLVLFLLTNSSSAFAQQKNPFVGVDSIPQVIQLEDTTLVESSGLAFSRQYAEVLYTHEDSKCSNKITAINLKGQTVGTIWIKDAENRDWEDIAVVQHPDGGNYIYLADIGDNGQKYASVSIYRFREPEELRSDMTVEAERFEYQYPEGPLNAEALLFDPLLQEFWVVSKEKYACGLYRLPMVTASQASGEVLMAEKKLTLPFDKITAGDISIDGHHILLRNKPNIYYWRRQNGHTLDRTLQQTPLLLPHRKEHQSEGIAFFPDGSGFVTSTEISKKSGLKPYISIYRVH